MKGKLARRAVEKPWGRTGLAAPFADLGAGAVGEVWFESPPEHSELLVKYIFADDALSVQVHPSDDQTLAAGLGRQGKEECWLVLDANPGAILGIGFHEAHDVEVLRAAALDGSIERLMRWFPVSAGDFFYIPAGTVHAIGGGITLLEIQQNSDVTWRLYDYGRPRALHLDEALAVARCEPYPERFHRRVPARGGTKLVDGPYFQLDLIDGSSEPAMVAEGSWPSLVIPLAGTVRIDGEPVAFGECSLAALGADLCFTEGSRGLIARPVLADHNEIGTH